MNLLAHRQPQTLFTDFAELLAPLTPLSGRPLLDSHLIRVEDEVTADRYTLRAELPGIDPEKDVDVTVSDGRLTIKAQRSERNETPGRSEFSYGSFARVIALPAGTDDAKIAASYDKGILTVSMPLTQPADAVKRIEVKNGA